MMKHSYGSSCLCRRGLSLPSGASAQSGVNIGNLSCTIDGGVGHDSGIVTQWNVPLYADRLDARLCLPGEYFEPWASMWA